MGQCQVGEEFAAPNILRLHRGQAIPRHAVAELGGRAHRDGLPAGHCGAGILPGREVVAALEQLPLRRHDAGLGVDIGLHRLLEGLHWFLGAERVSGEIEASHLPLVRLGRERGRRGGGCSRTEHGGAVMISLTLLRTCLRDSPWRLGILHGVGRPEWRWRLTIGRPTPKAEQNAANHESSADHRNHLPHVVLLGMSRRMPPPWL